MVGSVHRPFLDGVRWEAQDTFRGVPGQPSSAPDCMQIRTLLILVFFLTICVGLAATNPTIDQYLSFVETEMNRALERMDQSMASQERTLIQTVFRSQGKKIIQSVVMPNTIRRNWGLLSRFETRVLGEEVMVLGIAGRFVPLKGFEEATLKMGRLVF